MARFVLDHMPPTLHLVILTRADPALPLACLRVQDQLVELCAAVLRFTLDEAAAFLNQAMRLGLAPDAVTALTCRSVARPAPSGAR